MRPLRLYIKDFLCYDKGYIDFTEFSSALIVGKKENNDMYSNGVGKTTIFKAMEYVLFNQADTPLERIIRDDTNSCRIVLDFIIGDQVYRLSRSRTKKGSTDLTLLQRNGVDANANDALHSVDEIPYLDKKQTEKFWKDISGSRATDTEKDLAKLIKLNHKSFVSTALFPQNDMSGLPTATPEKRKGILKEAFNLLVYAKLEKIAKDRVATLTKDVDKNTTLLTSLGDPGKELLDLAAQLADADKVLTEKQADLDLITEESKTYSDKIAALTSTHAGLEGKFTALLAKEKVILAEKTKLETSVKEYQSKRANITKAAKDLVNEISSLKESQAKLAAIDFSQIDILNEKIGEIKKSILDHKVEVKSNQEKLDDANVPLPSGSVCKTCRKPMTDKERKEHKTHIEDDKKLFNKNIKKANESIAELMANEIALNTELNSLMRSRQQLETVNTNLTSKNKEMQDKRGIHEEYSTLLQKFTKEAADKAAELEVVQEDIKNSSLDEANIVKAQIDAEKLKLNTLVQKLTILNKEITHYNSNKAIIQHTIDQKAKDKLRKEELTKSLTETNEKLGMFPTVLQAFSTTGIPNLIIQNVLDDLQVESNNLLQQLKPGLQLSFFIEKTKGNGDQADTLDIKYTINGKDRYYEQLSGAMKLAVAFSLKLGLSFLLQKMTGADIKFLLLDEIDQALDKASVDAFADIVKFFQKDFTILIITHNDRLKDKFSHAILVEQDINMVSQARVVSSW